MLAFDLLFQHATDEDAILVEAITAARTETDARTRVVMPLVGSQRESPSGRMIEYAGFITPTATLREAATALGHVMSLPEFDGGAVRWQSTRIRGGDEVALSFGIVTYLNYLAVPASAFDQVMSYSNDSLTLVGPLPSHALPSEGAWPPTSQLAASGFASQSYDPWYTSRTHSHTFPAISHKS